MAWGNAAGSRRQYGLEGLVMDLPSSVLFELIDVLDFNKNWMRFAAELNYNMLDIERFGRSLEQRYGSPTRCIFNDWSGLKPTVRDLVCVLSRMRLVMAIQILEKCLPAGLLAQQGPSNDRQIGTNPYGVPTPGPPGPFYPSQSSKRPSFFQDQLQPPNPPTMGNSPYVNTYSRPQPGQHPLTPEHQRGFDQQFAQAYYPNTNPPMYMGVPSYPATQYERLAPQYQDINKNKLRSELPGYYPREAVESYEGYKCSSLFPEDRSRQGHSSINHRDRDVRNEALTSTSAYDYEHIRVATDNFNPKNIIGEGGFGTVYKGRIDNMDVAIKVLKKTSGHEDDQPYSRDAFLTELVNLRHYPHVNIIDLLGICYIRGPKYCLLHKFMPYGSLEDRLQCKGNTEPLHWKIRHNILVGASRGLTFLHTNRETPLIHGDIKSANILLDENMEPKLSDFGQARQATSSASTEGYTHFILDQKENYPLSEAYQPLEVFMGDSISLGVKTDTFSFGVVIFETGSGLKPIDAARGHDGRSLKNYLLNLTEGSPSQPLEKEKDLRAGDWPNDFFLGLVNLSFKCVSQPSSKRPSMKLVLSELEDMSLRILQMADHRPLQSSSDSNNCSSIANTNPGSDQALSYTKFRSAGDAPNQMNFYPPSMGDTSWDSILAAQNFRAGRLDPEEDPSLKSDEKKLAYMESFDNQARNQLSPSILPTPPPVAPPAPDPSAELKSGKPIPAARSQFLRQRNEPAQSSESPCGGVSIDEFGKLSLRDTSGAPSSIPLELQREYDRKKEEASLSTDNLSDQIAKVKETASPTNSESTYQAEYANRRKLQKKSLSFLMPTSPVQKSSEASLSGSDNCNIAPKTEGEHGEGGDGSKSSFAESPPDASLPSQNSCMNISKTPGNRQCPEVKLEPNVLQTSAAVFHEAQLRDPRYEQTKFYPYSTPPKEKLPPKMNRGPATFHNLEAPDSGDLGSIPTFAFYSGGGSTSWAPDNPAIESRDILSREKQPEAIEIIEPLLEDQERIKRLGDMRERKKTVV